MTILKYLTFDDVLLVPNYNHIESRKDVSTAVVMREPNVRFNIPIISANMDTITEVDMAVAMTAQGGLAIMHRFCTIEDNVAMYKRALEVCHRDSLTGYSSIGVSVGVGEKEIKRFEMLYAAGARIFCVDVAHAHSKLVSRMVKYIRDYSSGSTSCFVIAGNVATYSGADSLVGWGAHAVKVGIGAGSVCTTREKTGFGVPQLTAIMDCSKVDVPVIADGGIRKPGDVVKALAAGATMVMLGGMLAGTTETPGEWVGKRGFQKRYRGMASAEAQEDFFGATMPEWKTAEGITTIVDHKGPMERVIKDVIGGLRSGLTYAGARNIAELHRKAHFIEVTNATRIEGTPHGQM